MKREELAPHEGTVVCFCHRENKHDAIPSRWARGIVYEGTCYDLSTMQEGRPATLQVYLRPIKHEYLAEIFSLNEQQQTPFEQIVRTTLLRGETRYVSLQIPLLFGTLPKETEGQEDPPSRQDTMPPLYYSI